MQALIKRIDTEAISRFYMGNLYPVIICAMAVLGSITGLEFYLNMLHTVLIVGAFVFAPSIKPIFISLCTYIYQVSLKNSPGYPTYSDYYFTGWRLPIVIVIAALIVFGIVFFAVRKEIFKKLSFKKTPLLLPLVLFSAALMLGGAFSKDWTPGNLIFGIANVAVYLVIFIMVYYGLSENESGEEIAKYVAYIASLMTLVISIELIHLFLTSDTIFKDGAIVKDQVALGWGIWNLIGISLVVLIPLSFLGMMKNKCPWFYFATATLAYLMSALTMSRNALLFGTLMYAACVIVFSFVGKYKLAFRIIVIVGLVLAAAVAIIFFDKISALFKDYFDRGFDNNGRFELWSAAWEKFTASPVFGSGFYKFGEDPGAAVPRMAHNTVLELLSSLGIFGLLTYAYYRIKTLKPFISRPSITKTMLGFSILIIILESFFDNYLFDIYPMYLAGICLAVAFRISGEEATEKEASSEAS